MHDSMAFGMKHLKLLNMVLIYDCIFNQDVGKSSCLTSTAVKPHRLYTDLIKIYIFIDLGVFNMLKSVKMTSQFNNKCLLKARVYLQ